ncbi:hypothetical protein HMPREF9069_00967 [Atopobium sp. oral taxon 810 str. F0209]|nr:hypothetical protein HMPREF9069_00967 [Atopobium sp. oral taxon 810 str. F0209]
MLPHVLLMFYFSAFCLHSSLMLLRFYKSSRISPTSASRTMQVATLEWMHSAAASSQA